jgi:hypothetical protein
MVGVGPNRVRPRASAAGPHISSSGLCSVHFWSAGFSFSQCADLKVSATSFKPAAVGGNHRA